jgi:hypothetical protein
MLNSDALEIYAVPAPLLAPVVLPVIGHERGKRDRITVCL